MLYIKWRSTWARASLTGILTWSVRSRSGTTFISFLTRQDHERSFRNSHPLVIFYSVCAIKKIAMVCRCAADTTHSFCLLCCAPLSACMTEARCASLSFVLARMCAYKLLVSEFCTKARAAEPRDLGFNPHPGPFRSG
ncbi:hypothetical protein ANAPC5_01423 [Anaplasma phagocytophilum]|nr:hypothetical protein ANAPC5_01423 [Anaplasma phagocytophilum]